jgi:hypothetical protein
MTSIHHREANINNRERREWTAFKIAWALALAADQASRGLAHDVGTWLALKYHNSKSGEAWPGVEPTWAPPRAASSAPWTGWRGGWIERERRPGRSSRYRLAALPGDEGEAVQGVTPASPLTPRSGVTLASERGDVGVTPGVTYGSQRGDAGVTLSLREETTEPEREPGARRATRVGGFVLTSTSAGPDSKPVYHFKLVATSEPSPSEANP